MSIVEILICSAITAVTFLLVWTFLDWINDKKNDDEGD